MVDVEGRDVFISHEKSDSDVALDIAARLRSLGFSTWCYEEDSTPGASYLVQIDRAIERAHLVVVIASRSSLRSPHVRNEIVRAYESQKRFIPVRRDLAHEELLRGGDADDDERRREWRMAFGAAVSVPWDPEFPEMVVARIADGLRRAGVVARDDGWVETPAQKDRDVATNRVAPRELSEAVGVRPGTITDRTQRDTSVDHVSRGIDIAAAPYTRVAVVIVAALIGAYLGFDFLVAIFDPRETGRYYAAAPPLRFVNFAASAAFIALQFRLLQRVLPLLRGEWQHESQVRNAIDIQLRVVAGWLLVAMLIALFGLREGYDSMRRAVVNWLLLSAFVALIPFVIARVLFSMSARRYPAGVRVDG